MTIYTSIRRIVSIVIVLAFIGTSVQAPALAQVLSVDPMPYMPAPGTMVSLSAPYTPAYLKGIVIHPENALRFDFIIYKGDQPLTDAQKRDEYTKLTKYFLASLAIPDEDQWVNLSPYEKNHIIKDDFGKTEMGRDLLAQDYMLKQITSSLIYPENNLGKQFWQTIFAKAQQQFGTTDIPVNTFNKVWILPDDALIYEKGNTAYVLKNHLRVMLEEDYLSLKNHAAIPDAYVSNMEGNNGNIKYINNLGSQVVREIVLPELQREVNEDQNFAALRQVYSGMLLATWYKHALRESLLSKIYADKSKVKGVDQDPKTNEQIYRQYLSAYRRGAFNFIKEEVDQYSNEVIPRKYFSGGAEHYDAAMRVLGFNPIKVTPSINYAQVQAVHAESPNLDLASIAAEEQNVVPYVNKPALINSTQANEGSASDRAMVGNLRRVLTGEQVLRVFDLAGVLPVLLVSNNKGLIFVRQGSIKTELLPESTYVLGETEPRLFNVPENAKGIYQFEVPERGERVKITENAQATNRQSPLKLPLILDMVRKGDTFVLDKAMIMGPKGNTLINQVIPSIPSYEFRGNIASKVSPIWPINNMLFNAPIEKENKKQNNEQRNQPPSNERYVLYLGKLLDNHQGRLLNGVIALAAETIKAFPYLEPVVESNPKTPGMFSIGVAIKRDEHGLLPSPETQTSVLGAVKVQLQTVLAQILYQGGVIQPESKPIGMMPRLNRLFSRINPLSHANPAMITEQPRITTSEFKNPGGIDFNSANLNLQIKRDGNGVPLPVSEQDLQNIHIDGLVPIIIDIQPANSLPLFADLQSTVKTENG